MLSQWLPPDWWNKFRDETLVGWQDRALHHEQRAQLAEDEVEQLRQKLVDAEQKISTAQTETIIAQMVADTFRDRALEAEAKIKALETTLQAREEKVGAKRRAP